jgi:WD40-like Beta Propeller Repeat
MRVGLVGVLVCGCGSVSNNQMDGASVDGMNDASPPRCNLSAPFGAPTPISSVNTVANDSSGHLSSDRLALYFVSERGGGPGREDLFVATRTSETSVFGTPTVIVNVNSASYDEGAVISADGLALYLSSNRNNGVDHELFVANRTTVAGVFSTPALLLGVNSTSHDLISHVNAAQTVMYVQSNRSGNYDLYRAERASTTQAFDTPVSIGALNDSMINDASLVVTDDELTAYFSSTRAGGAGADVYKATRSTLNDGFGALARVAELNTTFEDHPSWISPDGCDILLSTNRTGGAGNYDIWSASKPSL